MTSFLSCNVEESMNDLICNRTAPHTAHITRTFLNDNFPHQWVGKFGPIQWSPDLTSCDNALWSIIKNSLLAENARSTMDLKQAIANFNMESL